MLPSVHGNPGPKVLDSQITDIQHTSSQSTQAETPRKTQADKDTHAQVPKGTHMHTTTPQTLPEAHVYSHEQ